MILYAFVQNRSISTWVGDSVSSGNTASRAFGTELQLVTFPVLVGSVYVPEQPGIDRLARKGIAPDRGISAFGSAGLAVKQTNSRPLVRLMDEVLHRRTCHSGRRKRPPCKVDRRGLVPADLDDFPNAHRLQVGETVRRRSNRRVAGRRRSRDYRPRPRREYRPSATAEYPAPDCRRPRTFCSMRPRCHRSV